MAGQCTCCTSVPYALSCRMPTVERFNRCRIEMYFKDHAPPHFHIVTTSNERISVVIESLEVLAGTADSRDVTEALTWAKTNRDTLRRLWREYSE
jgi:hypothetical protein